jgi:glycosyltransferase involved in cell wall biosynthesis/SAM-dependent methyltransferase
MAKVSFIIPCHNLGAYLDRTVRSVLDQRYKQFEVLIVDDGSTDSATQHLFVSYQRPQTRVLRLERHDSAAAKNLGIYEATGDYIAFLETGDLLEPTFLERMIEPLEADASIAFTGCLVSQFGAFQYRRQPAARELPHILAGDRSWRVALVRKDILLAVGGLDNSISAAGYDEWDLSITLVAHGMQGQLIPECLLSRRVPALFSGNSQQCDDHARLVPYIVDKHQESFRRHSAEVIGALEDWIQTLKTWLPETHEHPFVVPASGLKEDAADRWREAILALLFHSRQLEEQIFPMSDSAARIPLGAIDWGDLRRLEPISAVWGLDRGQPIDRYYIEQFLGRHREDIHGRVLEVKDPVYTQAFGSGVEASDIVDIVAENPHATLVCDLAVDGSLPENSYDCFILTQTIHIIHEVDIVLRNAMRTLRPGGVLLATLPCVSRVDYESGLEGDQWRFTPASARRLFEDTFGVGQIESQTFGNVLTCCAFLMGVSAGELSQAELDRRDAYFPLLIGVRAVKTVSPEQQINDLARIPRRRPDAAVHEVSTPMEETFRIIAIMSTYNEGDIIASVLGHLIEHGIDVYLIDNQSTDDTVARASP